MAQALTLWALPGRPVELDAMALPKFDASGGMESAAEKMTQSTFIECREGAQVRGWLALEFRQWQAGRELVITGAVQAGPGRESRIDQFLPLVEALAMENGAARITVQTVRGGLVRLLASRGYRVQPVRTLRKVLQ